MKLQPLGHMQSHQPPYPIPAQAAQGPIQPGLEHLQGRGIHSLSGQLFQHLTTLIVKNFPLISNINLPSFNLNFPCPALGQLAASRAQLSLPLLGGFLHLSALSLLLNLLLLQTGCSVKLWKMC